jgi:hypothetical protein
MDQRTYTAIAGTQIAVVALGIIGVGIYSARLSSGDSNYSAKFLWDTARTVVIFLPMALAWFSLFSAMFFQDMYLAIPVLVGVFAVGANFILDGMAFKWDTFGYLYKLITTLQNKPGDLISAPGK